MLSVKFRRRVKRRCEALLGTYDPAVNQAKQRVSIINILHSYIQYSLNFLFAFHGVVHKVAEISCEMLTFANLRKVSPAKFYSYYIVL